MVPSCDCPESGKTLAEKSLFYWSRSFRRRRALEIMETPRHVAQFVVAIVMVVLTRRGLPRVLASVGFHGTLAATWSFECLHAPGQTQPARIEDTKFSFLGDATARA
jgi:hypothetical protein